MHAGRALPCMQVGYCPACMWGGGAACTKYTCMERRGGAACSDVHADRGGWPHAPKEHAGKGGD